MALARSPFVAFLDDDNEWEPRHLEGLLQALDAGAGLAYSDVVRYAPDGRVVDVLCGPWDRRAFADSSSWVDTSAVAVRNDGARFSRLRRSADTMPGEVEWEFVYRVSRRRWVVHVPEVTVRYLVNPDSYFTTW